ncbi:hypothetical protein A2U01_0062814, partial [Trifolium medium]|nr:hypothetical protein [Trifolium medium]
AKSRFCRSGLIPALRAALLRYTQLSFMIPAPRAAPTAPRTIHFHFFPGCCATRRRPKAWKRSKALSYLMKKKELKKMHKK